jgi:hypothetical protein
MADARDESAGSGSASARAMSRGAHAARSAAVRSTRVPCTCSTRASRYLSFASATSTHATHTSSALGDPRAPSGEPLLLALRLRARGGGVAAAAAAAVAVAAVAAVVAAVTE